MLLSVRFSPLCFAHSHFLAAEMASKYTAEHVARLFMSEPSQDSFEGTPSDDEDSDDEFEINEAVHEYYNEIESDEESVTSDSLDDKMKGRNGFQWSKNPPHRASYRKQNIVRVPGGLTSTVSRLSDVHDFFRIYLILISSRKSHCTPISECPTLQKK